MAVLLYLCQGTVLALSLRHCDNIACLPFLTFKHIESDPPSPHAHFTFFLQLSVFVSVMALTARRGLVRKYK